MVQGRIGENAVGTFDPPPTDYKVRFEVFNFGFLLEILHDTVTCYCSF